MFRDFKIPCLQTIDELEKKCKELGIGVNAVNFQKYREIVKKHEKKVESNENEMQVDGEIGERNESVPNNAVRKYGLDGKIQSSTSDDNLNSIIENLDNFHLIREEFNYYLQLSDYAKKLNAQLVRYNNKPIIVTNKVDREMPPSFNYVNDYKLDLLSPEVLQILEDNRQRCECENQCSSSSNNLACCACLFDDQSYYEDSGRIKDSITTRGPIVECSNLCSCDERCPNRIIQKGTQIKLELFKTRNGKGWGLKTLEKIPKGTFICTYRGEIITSEQASIRQKINPHANAYFFDLDYNDEMEFEYVIDGSSSSNLGRFINHSCTPNCETFVVHIESTFSKIPVVAFFSSVQIRKGQELTFDYFMSNKKNQLNRRVACLCNTKNCMKYYFF